MVVMLTLVEFLQECSKEIKGYKEDDGAENVVEGKSDGQNKCYKDSGIQNSAANNRLSDIRSEVWLLVMLDDETYSQVDRL